MVSFEYKNRILSKNGQLYLTFKCFFLYMKIEMQVTSKRVRTIYSVIASANRLDILRILNSKGPLSYSELKTLAGFKSKKESGKFAYHLRKLVRQLLVTLNRAERRYTVTNLGKLIVKLTKEIERVQFEDQEEEGKD